MSKLVFDVGGSSIKYALMQEDGSILSQGSVDTPKKSREDFLHALANIASKFSGQFDGIAISMPGNIDSETGQVYTAGALTYNENVNIVSELSRLLPYPISIENDGKCAALAEVWQGNLKDNNSGVIIVIGTGIGGGIVINRQILKGSNFFAGELSYVIGNVSEPSFKSCMAVKGSTTALVLGYCQRKGLDPRQVDGKKVFDAIQAKDEDALAALDDMCTALAVLIFNLQVTLDCGKVCIGGGVSKQPILVETIKSKVDGIYQHLPYPVPRPEIDVCKHFNDSNLLGALYHHLTLFSN